MDTGKLGGYEHFATPIAKAFYNILLFPALIQRDLEI